MIFLDNRHLLPRVLDDILTPKRADTRFVGLSEIMHGARQSRNGQVARAARVASHRNPAQGARPATSRSQGPAKLKTRGVVLPRTAHRGDGDAVA